MAEDKKTEGAPEAKTFDEIHAGAIREKMAAGLDKTQAIEVVRSQLAHDIWLREQEEAAAKAAKKAKAAG
jgi:hypothetical protein